MRQPSRCCWVQGTAIPSTGCSPSPLLPACLPSTPCLPVLPCFPPQVKITVYEGERAKVEDNSPLGTFDLTGGWQTVRELQTSGWLPAVLAADSMGAVGGRVGACRGGCGQHERCMPSAGARWAGARPAGQPDPHQPAQAPAPLLHATALAAALTPVLPAGIPPAPRGIPKIKVSFSIDANGAAPPLPSSSLQPRHAFVRACMRVCAPCALRYLLGAMAVYGGGGWAPAGSPSSPGFLPAPAPGACRHPERQRQGHWVRQGQPDHHHRDRQAQVGLGGLGPQPGPSHHATTTLLPGPTPCRACTPSPAHALVP